MQDIIPEEDEILAIGKAGKNPWPLARKKRVVVQVPSS